MEVRAATWQEIWTSADSYEHLRTRLLLAELKADALEDAAMVPRLTLKEVKKVVGSLTLNAGLGADNIAPGELLLVPEAGWLEFVSLLNQMDLECQVPIQELCNVPLGPSLLAMVKGRLLRWA